MKLDIILKSDLCTSSGENYNSYIDTDVVFDDYGLPYIPAKRLKGVLKEAALELVEFGLFSYGDYNGLFGMEGNARAGVIIDNAFLVNAKEYIEDINRCPEEIVIHPQRVLNLFTTTRTQTALDKTGVAKENSLRTFRVIHRGNRFEAGVKLRESLTERQKQLLIQSARMVKHMGSKRTRGLGQVEITLTENHEKGASKAKTFVLSDKNCIHYQITLNGSVLCKRSNGNQEKTDDYIQGSKVLGILAEAFGNDLYRRLTEDTCLGEELIVSNAYICHQSLRCTPAALSLQKKKDQAFENGKMMVKDRLIGFHDEEQRSPLGAVYLSPQGVMKHVDTQIQYHHKRPDNKAIGHATGNDNSSFYQLKCICSGQTFAGYIIANKVQAEQIVEKLGSTNRWRMGNNKYAEYGNVTLQITDVSACKKQTLCTGSFAVKLNAAAILYNECGMPSSDVQCLVNELEQALSLQKGSLGIKKSYVNYEEVGGYNVTWNRRKPKFTALGKGTVVLLEQETAASVEIEGPLFVGERVAEGYGELEILSDIRQDVMIQKEEAAEVKDGNYVTDLVSRLKKQQYILDLKEQARKTADTFAKDFVRNSECTATLGKLILLSKTTAGLKEFADQIGGIESESKKKLALEMWKQIAYLESDSWKMLKICEEDAQVINDIVFREILPEYLSQLKYLLRAEKGGSQ